MGTKRSLTQTPTVLQPIGISVLMIMLPEGLRFNYCGKRKHCFQADVDQWMAWNMVTRPDVITSF